jgi:DNA-directed RNA polymerase specialized sigma24 family protein
MAITVNKSVDLIRAQNRQKRGGTGGAQRTSAGSDEEASRVGKPTADHVTRHHGVRKRPVAVPLSELISVEPTPEFAAELSDQLQHLLTSLDATGDTDLRKMALLKMEGYSTAEIAQAIGCVPRSVERKMHIIMRIWGKDLDL